MKRLFLVALGTGMGLLLMEGGLRLSGIGAPVVPVATDVSEVSRLYAPDPVLGWTLVPGASARQRVADFDVTYTIDGTGRRAGPPAAPSGDRRIAVFGDSFTFGVGVPDDATFERLASVATGDEIMNFGVSGYDPGQYLLALRERARSDRFDAVVFAIYLGNDIEDLPLDHLFAQPDKRKPHFDLADGRLALRAPSVTSSSSAALRDYRLKSGWWGSVAQAALRLRTVVLMKGVLKGPLYPFLARIRVVKSIADYDAHFALLAAVLRDAASAAPAGRFGVIIIPSKNIRENYLERQFGARMERMLAELDIPYENMTAAAEADGGLYFEREGHWNERGHARAAEALGRLLSSMAHP